jgi:hypothetical protein
MKPADKSRRYRGFVTLVVEGRRDEPNVPLSWVFANDRAARSVAAALGAGRRWTLLRGVFHDARAALLDGDEALVIQRGGAAEREPADSGAFARAEVEATRAPLRSSA